MRECNLILLCYSLMISFDLIFSLYSSSTEAPIGHMHKFFCFAQSTSSGKVLGVFYPKREKEWVVNIKRSIASAFQANYKETPVANETDSQSKHKSHYKYKSILFL